MSGQGPGWDLGLIHDNSKNYRLGRRLPIAKATAAVITAEQERVRERFPDTPADKLKLPPSPVANPAGEVEGQLVTKLLRSTSPRSFPTPTGTPSLSGTRTPTSTPTCSWI